MKLTFIYCNTSTGSTSFFASSHLFLCITRVCSQNIRYRDICIYKTKISIIYETYISKTHTTISYFVIKLW